MHTCIVVCSCFIDSGTWQGFMVLKDNVGHARQAHPAVAGVSQVSEATDMEKAQKIFLSPQKYLQKHAFWEVTFFAFQDCASAMLSLKLIYSSNDFNHNCKEVILNYYFGLILYSNDTVTVLCYIILYRMYCNILNNFVIC